MYISPVSHPPWPRAHIDVTQIEYRAQQVCTTIPRYDQSIKLTSEDEVDSVETFLKKIGRNSHIAAAPKISDWDKLFTMSSTDMKQAGLDTRQRK